MHLEFFVIAIQTIFILIISNYQRYWVLIQKNQVKNMCGFTKVNKYINYININYKQHNKTHFNIMMT